MVLTKDGGASCPLTGDGPRGPGEGTGERLMGDYSRATVTEIVEDRRVRPVGLAMLSASAEWRYFWKLPGIRTVI